VGFFLKDRFFINVETYSERKELHFGQRHFAQHRQTTRDGKQDKKSKVSVISRRGKKEKQNIYNDEILFLCLIMCTWSCILSFFMTQNKYRKGKKVVMKWWF